MKLQPGEFYAAGMDELPRIPFGRESVANKGLQIWLIEWLLRDTPMDSEGNFHENTKKRDCFFFLCMLPFDLESILFYANNLKTKVRVFLGIVVFASKQTDTCSRNWVL